MQLTRQLSGIDDKPANLTALSLVLFLLASLLAMMAAYDPGRPPDDVRNSVVITLHEHAAPSSDSNPDETTLPVALARELWPLAPSRKRASAARVLSVPFPASPFEARGPPARGVFMT